MPVEIEFGNRTKQIIFFSSMDYCCLSRSQLRVPYVAIDQLKPMR